MIERLRLAVTQHWVWLFPAIVVLTLSPFSLTNLDSTRDFIMAHRIISGTDLPMLGPQLAFSFHIGPWWFYLMAWPLIIIPSWLAMAMVVATLNGLKFFLAYRIGCLLKDRLLGQLMVASLLMISLTAMQTITFTHTNLVETCMLLLIWYSVKTQLNSHWHWLVLGLLAAIAFHSHPTAVLAGYFAFIMWLKQSNKITKAWMFLIGVLLVFSPVLIQELALDGQISQGMGNYLSQQTGGLHIFDLFKLWYGLLISGPLGLLTINLHAVLVALLLGIQVFIQLAAICLPWTVWQQADPIIKKWYLHSSLFFLLTSIGLLLIRDRTPWYMSYGLSLSFSLLVAFGLYLVLSKLETPAFKRLILTLLLTSFLVLNYSFVPVLNQGTVRLPSTTLYDLKSNNHDLSAAGFEIPAWQAAAHGEFTCTMRPVSLHGTYAAMVYAHSGMEHLGFCDSGLYYGPGNERSHLLGIPDNFLTTISVQPINQIGATYFFQPIDNNDEQLSWAETFQHDYERQLTQLVEWDHHTIQTQLHGGQHILITQLAGFKMRTHIVAVKVNGQTLESHVGNNYSLLYQCESCDPKDTVWEVSYQESVKGMTNIVTF